MSNYLTAEQILAASDLPTQDFDVPRWGGRIKIKAVGVAAIEFVSYVNAPLPDGTRPSADEINKRTFTAAVIMGALRPDGTRLFGWEQADALREKHYGTIIKVAQAIFDLSAADSDLVGSIEEGKDS